jgi:hypothetical protein
VSPLRTHPVTRLLLVLLVTSSMVLSGGWSPDSDSNTPNAMCPDSPQTDCTKIDPAWDDETSWLPPDAPRPTGLGPNGNAGAANAPVAGFGQYTVDLAAGTITGPSGITAIAATDRAIVLNGDVWVRGTYSQNRRLTIVARNRAAAGDAGRAADIHLIGPAVGFAAGTGRSLGLVAQGNIVLEMPSPAGGGINAAAAGSSNPCLTYVGAALLAETGRVQIPAEYMTETPWSYRSDITSTTAPINAAPICGGQLVINGSVTAHVPPQLTWTWKPEGPGYPSYTTGYTNRQYLWNPELLRTPPPFFPTSEDWRTEGWREGNPDCLTTTGSVGGRSDALEVDCT